MCYPLVQQSDPSVFVDRNLEEKLEVVILCTLSLAATSVGSVHL